MQKELALVYPVAGLSSRFRGKIKQFAKVGPNGETLIEYSLSQALPAEFTKIIFIVGNKTEALFKEKFGNSYKGISVYYAPQKFNSSERDKPWGTADALCSAIDFIDCPFVVCNGDDLYGKKTFAVLAEHLRNNLSGASVGFKLEDVLPEKGETNRAIFQKDSEDFVTDLREVLGVSRENLKEKRVHLTDLCSMNIFALQPKAVKDLLLLVNSFKEKNKSDRKIECLLPEELSNLIKQGKLKLKLYPAEESWLGITNPEDEEVMRKKLASLD